jgi:hypothetical protein
MTVRKSRISALALLLLAACSDGGGKTIKTKVEPTPVPTVTGVRVVSGDSQVAYVRGAPPRGAAFAGTELVLAEPLVARLVVENRAAAATLLEITGPGGGPALQTTPVLDGWTVQWATEPDGCGRPLEPVTQIQDAEGHTSNRLAVGSRVGTCTARVSAVRNGQVMHSATFSYEQALGLPEPGRFFDGHHPEATTSMLLSEQAVTYADGTRVPFRIETPADSAVWAGSAVFGTAESRTLHFAAAAGTPRQGNVFLLDASGRRVARVLYVLFATGGAEYTSYPGETQ